MSNTHVVLELMAAGSRGPIQQSRELFHVLGKIQSLLFVAGSENRQDLIHEALGLVEEHTENTRWRNEIAAQLAPSDPHHKNEKWEIAVLDDFNANIARSKDTQDFTHIGNTYVRAGMYAEARAAYSRSPESLALNSSLGIFQRNWEFVVTALAKVFLSNQGTMQAELKLNLALAYWYTREYGKCTAVLLHMDVDELRDKQSSIWLSRQNVRSMLIVSVLLELDRESLEYFEAADPIALHLDLSEIVRAYANSDISTFWEMLEKQLDLPVLDHDDSVAKLADKLRKNWLSVHSKVPLKDVLQQFRRARPDAAYSSADLVDDLAKWKAPYKVDFVDKSVVYSETKPDPRAAAETLAYEFRRDALLLLWGKRYETQEFPE